MAKAGVIGWPVSHSLSPRLHGFWLRQHKIEGAYEALAVPTGDLASVTQRLVAEQWRGFNLTIPHKEAVIPLLHGIDDAARAIGAVNTVVINGAKLIGHNTDAYGFWENIRPSVAQRNKAVVLGAGGAARAVVHALRANGFKQIVIINRSRERAEILCGETPDISVGDWAARATLLECADVLVNTTSLGMTGKDALDLDLSLLPTSAVVNDIVYAPLQTPLLMQAQARGNTVVDGLGMLLHQAVPAFEAWFGVRPQVTQALREHVLAGAGA